MPLGKDFEIESVRIPVTQTNDDEQVDFFDNYIPERIPSVLGAERNEVLDATRQSEEGSNNN